MGLNMNDKPSGGNEINIQVFINYKPDGGCTAFHDRRDDLFLAFTFILRPRGPSPGPYKLIPGICFAFLPHPGQLASALSIGAANTPILALDLLTRVLSATHEKDT